MSSMYNQYLVNTCLSVFSLACSGKCEWNVLDYIPLHAPLSPCVTLQWTCRDGRVINLPCGLLVEGDVILLRPGQEVPARCRSMRVSIPICVYINVSIKTSEV